MITYRDDKGRETTLEAPLTGKPAPWLVLYYETARVSDGSIQGWTIVHRADTWREAATWSNLFRGTRFPLTTEAP